LSHRIKAVVLLALAVVRTFFRRLFGGAKGGIRAFREHYAPDGLAPVTPSQREAMNGFGGCIACGLCDRGERARIERSDGAYRGVMELILAASRSMPDFGAAAMGFAHVPDEVLAEKERICPTRVPMREIAKFVREKAGEARVSLALGSSPPSTQRPGKT
jgi:hypothetical protein